MHAATYTSTYDVTSGDITMNEENDLLYNMHQQQTGYTYSFATRTSHPLVYFFSARQRIHQLDTY